jgi:hypothetical protein
MGTTAILSDGDGVSSADVVEISSLTI